MIDSMSLIERLRQDMKTAWKEQIRFRLSVPRLAVSVEKNVEINKRESLTAMVMGAIMPKIQGKADCILVNQLVKNALQ